MAKVTAQSTPSDPDKGADDPFAGLVFGEAGPGRTTYRPLDLTWDEISPRVREILVHALGDYSPELPIAQQRMEAEFATRERAEQFVSLLRTAALTRPEGPVAVRDVSIYARKRAGCFVARFVVLPLEVTAS